MPPFPPLSHVLQCHLAAPSQLHNYCATPAATYSCPLGHLSSSATTHTEAQEVDLPVLHACQGVKLGVLLACLWIKPAFRLGCPCGLGCPGSCREFPVCRLVWSHIVRPSGGRVLVCRPAGGQGARGCRRWCWCTRLCHGHCLLPWRCDDSWLGSWLGSRLHSFLLSERIVICAVLTPEVHEPCRTSAVVDTSCDEEHFDNHPHRRLHGGDDENRYHHDEDEYTNHACCAKECLIYLCSGGSVLRVGDEAWDH